MAVSFSQDTQPHSVFGVKQEARAADAQHLDVLSSGSCHSTESTRQSQRQPQHGGSPAGGHRPASSPHSPPRVPRHLFIPESLIVSGAPSAGRLKSTHSGVISSFV